MYDGANDLSSLEFSLFIQKIRKLKKMRGLNHYSLRVFPLLTFCGPLIIYFIILMTD